MWQSVIFLCFFLISKPVFSGIDLRGDHTENFSSRGLNFLVSLSKMRFNNEEKIIPQFILINKGFYPITFYLHRNYFRNFTILLRNHNGQTLPLQKDPNDFLKKNKNDTFFGDYTQTNYHSRAITLQPGESFKRSFNLKDLISIPNPSRIDQYSLTGIFYPNPEQHPKLYVNTENSVTIFIENSNQIDFDLNKDEFFKQKKLEISPREIVYLALSAEFQKNWSDFFKYISIRDLIRDYPDYANQYMHTKESNKFLVLNRFRSYLINRNTHQLISFEILPDFNQEVESAKVRVHATRKIEGLNRKFSYTYYLTKNKNLWLITGVDSRLVD